MLHIRKMFRNRKIFQTGKGPDRNNISPVDVSTTVEL